MSTNCYDDIDSPVNIARKIFGHLFKEQNTSKKVPYDKYEKERNNIFKLIETIYGIDFNRYKESSIGRRLEKRLAELKIKNLCDYWCYIQCNREEIHHLYSIMLIGVTSFFRDAEAFKGINDEISKIIEAKEEGDEIKAWVAGCASGEEAFSLAILFSEAIERSGKKINLKILASDIDENSLEKASIGIYDQKHLEGLPTDYLEKYFIKNKNQYRIIPDISLKILFTKHNLLNDPPFTKLDLISCRNLLIYLDNRSQKYALGLFFFSLNPKGILFLGPSESLGEMKIGYHVINPKWKIFQKPQTPNFKQSFSYIKACYKHGNPISLDYPKKSEKLLRHDEALPNNTDLHASVISSLLPPSFLVDKSLNIISIFGKMPFKSEFRAGRVTQNLKSFLDPSLYSMMSICVRKSLQDKIEVEYPSFTLVQDDKELILKLKISPIFDSNIESEPAHFLLSISEQKSSKKSKAEKIEFVDHQQIAILEQELDKTKDQLEATIKELEVTNEELHSTNQELLASNEELQATNEELHSVNEELYTINAEYQTKIEQLNELTRDEKKFFTSTGIGTVFIDDKLRIRKFNPKATKYFNILDHDIGRPIEHITHVFKNINFIKILKDVVSKKLEYQEEMIAKSGLSYLVKFTPYSLERDKGTEVVISFIEIQAMKDANSKLEQQNKVLNFVTEETNDGWWDWLITKDYEYMSPLFWNTLGYDPATKRHHPSEWQDLIHPDDLEAVLQNFDEHVKTKGKVPYHNRVRYKHKDGHWVWVICRGKVVEWNKQGKPVRMVGVHTDITELVNKELALEESNQRYHLVLKGASVGIWDWYDMSQNKEYWSPKFYELLGYLPDEIPATLENFKEILHPDDREKTFALLDKHISTGAYFDVDYRLKTKSGSYKWFRGSGQVSKGTQNLPQRMVGSIQDIHEKKLIEIQQNNLIAKLSKTENMTKSGHWHWDIQTQQMIWSRAIFDIFEIDSSLPPLSDEEAFTYVFEEDRSELRKILNHSIKNKEPYVCTYRIEVKDKLKYLHRDGAPLYDEGNKLVGFIGIIQDVTELRKKELELKDINKNLAKSNDDLERFAYITSHDLKAPLRGIANLKFFIEEDLGEILCSNDDRAKKVHSHLNRLGEQVSKMESLISGILEYSKIESSVVSIKEISIDNIIEEIAKDGGYSLKKQLIIEGELPTLCTDVVRLAQVFSNLIGNAFKYHHNPKQAKVIVSAEKSGEFIKFSIKDNGPGISKKYHEKIFQIFQTLQAKTNPDSTGIGLTLVKRIVENFGGTIELDSSLGSGSTFSFYWPMHIERKLVVHD